MGIFLLPAFIPGYTYVNIRVITADKAASRRLIRKLFPERKLPPVIRGIMINESMNAATRRLLRS